MPKSLRPLSSTALQLGYAGLLPQAFAVFLLLDGSEMRWTDPVPQAGSWTLTTPEDKVISLEFERIDGTTIGVTASGGDRSIELKVSALGIVTRR